MKTISFFILSIFLSINIFSQQIGEWKNHTSMRNVKASGFDSQGNIFAATSGGVFIFNRADSSYKTYTKSDGLNSHNITSLAVDSNDKVWVGNNNGVINIINIETEIINSIFSIQQSNYDIKSINHLSISGDTVFVSTDFGVTLFNATTLSVIEDYRKFGSFPSAIKVLYTVKYDLIYICTENGIAIQKSNAVNLAAPESWETFSNGTDIPASNILKVVKYNGGLLASSSDNGLLFYNNSNWTHHSFSNGSVKDIAAINDSVLVGFNSGLYSVNPASINLVQSLQNLTLNSISSLSNKDIFLCSNRGIMDYAKPENFYFPNGPQTNLFPDLDVDQDGNLWSASGSASGAEGAYKLNNGTWTNYNTTNGLVEGGNFIHMVYVSSKNDVYFSSWGNGFTVLSDGDFTTYNSSNTDLIGVPANNDFLVIQDIMEDRNGNIWFLNSESAGYNALNVLSEGSIIQYRPPLLNSQLAVVNLVIDRNGTKWFSIGGLGLFYFNENGTLSDKSDDIWGRFTTTNGLNSNEITALALDTRDDLWIGTPEGVNFISDPNNGESKIQNVFGSINQQSITAIEVDAINQKWFGTNQGVFLMSADAVTLINNYTEKNSPLPSNQISDIAVDGKSGKVYIGTSNGLTSLVSTSLQPVESFDELFIYPNPYLINDGETPLVIKGLVRNSTIKILTISGKLVKELITPGGGITQWDGRNEEGDYVASGVYLIVAYDEEANNVTTSKVAIVKK